MVDLAMSIFEFLTKILVFWHPWVCIRSVCSKWNLKQIEAIPPSVKLKIPSEIKPPLQPKKRKGKENVILTKDDELVEEMFEKPLDTIMEEDLENPEISENQENHEIQTRKNPFDSDDSDDSNTDGEFDESIEIPDIEVEEFRSEE